MHNPEKDLNTVSKEGILNKIKKEKYTFLSDGKTTICQLTLENGYTVLGSSACVDPKNFNEELGKSISKSNAIDKIWELEGYLLAQRIYESKETI